MNHPASSDSLKLLSDLRRLGFTESEARIYIALVEHSPATAYEVANRAGVARPNTYSVLKALAARRAVMPVSNNPVRYVPQPAERLFASIANETGELCRAVADRLSAMETPRGDEYVWNLAGDAEVHGKVASMIASARQAVWFKADTGVLRRHAEGLRAAAVGRGIGLRVILYGEEPEEFRYTDRCEVYVHEGTGFPMGFADNHFTLAVDHREMLTANLADGVAASHTENPAIVTLALSLLRHDYYMAEIFRVLRPEIDAEFGPNLRDLRQHSYSPEQFAQFEKRQARRRGSG